ncbi:type III secretion system chaperone [Pseudothauera rhizosphaerae]|uniref:Tir chaperone protein (CesT) family protein n=1 Tax=Pseudothauera rhizosphaerae TaxID=2565932 RepID=A0A4S4AWT9_9RHOO|nr:type III secretion system chaperone [Pseudothauera rhizosphaerae]THF64113.1 hypothetical protein E6O51_01960 [Pseudothauera rhizosphaerae]
MNATASSFANADFARFALSLDPGIIPSSTRSFALAFDDVSAQVVLSHDERQVLTEFFVADIAGLADARRDLVVKALLTLNASGLEGRPFVCGLDSRDFVTVHGQTPLAGLDTARFAESFDYLLRQARRVRELVGQLSFHNGGVTLVVPPAPTTGEQ